MCRNIQVNSEKRGPSQAGIVASDHRFDKFFQISCCRTFVIAREGLSMLDDSASQTAALPPAESLPSGLADHPDDEVIRELGQGGMGTIYLAKNRLMGRHGS